MLKPRDVNELIDEAIEETAEDKGGRTARRIAELVKARHGETLSGWLEELGFARLTDMASRRLGSQTKTLQLDLFGDRYAIDGEIAVPSEVGAPVWKRTKTARFGDLLANIAMRGKQVSDDTANWSAHRAFADRLRDLGITDDEVIGEFLRRQRPAAA